MTSDAVSAGTPPPDLDRPPQHIVDLAVEVSTWSPCRSKRGVVIFTGQQVVAHGHNFKPAGFDCDGSDACKATCRDEAVHAEQLALMSAGTKAAYADVLHVKTVDGKLVPSGGPSCVQCSKLMLAARVDGVWLYHDDGWLRYPMVNFHRRSLAELDRLRSLVSQQEEERFNLQQYELVRRENSELRREIARLEARVSPSDRVWALAQAEALRVHSEATSHGFKASNGHNYGNWRECKHPDCVLVRERRTE